MMKGLRAWTPKMGPICLMLSRHAICNSAPCSKEQYSTCLHAGRPNLASCMLNPPLCPCVRFLLPLLLLPAGAWALDRKIMDPQAAPTSDFYEYANGAWIKDHPIRQSFRSGVPGKSYASATMQHSVKF